MAQIESYKKNGKTFYRVINLYIGRDENTGKKKYKKKAGFKRKADAQLWIGKILELVEKNGTKSIYSREMTFGELYKLFLEHQRRNTTPANVQRLQQYMKHQVLPYLRNKKLKDIKVAYLQELVYQWHDNYKTYAQLRRRVSQVFGYAVSLEIIDTNPMAKTLLPRAKPDNETKLKFWTKEELHIFLDAVDEFGTPYMKIFFRLLSFTGMRRGEALALTWDDINFKKRELSITKTASTNEQMQTYIKNSPKTQSSIRTIVLDRMTLQLLKQWRNVQKEELLLYGYNSNDNEQLVFNYLKTNKVFDIKEPNRWMNDIIRKYNDGKKKTEQLPRITPHNLRHTHISLLLEAGVPLKEVSERVGHKNSKITFEIYAHVNKTQKKNAIEQFEKFMEI